MKPPPPDAMTPPPPPPDAGPPEVQVTVIIAGNGSVSASIGAECARGTCTYRVAANTAVTLTAVDHGANVFERWQGAPCAGQDRTCQFSATAANTTASVVFGHRKK